jgi:hypothetical protein
VHVVMLETEAARVAAVFAAPPEEH